MSRLARNACRKEIRMLDHLRLRSHLAPTAACLTLAFAVIAGACQKTPPEPESRPEPKAEAQSSAIAAAAAALAPTPTPTPTAPPAPPPKPEPPVSPDDPLHGKFSLDDASAGLAGKGPFSAEIDTELGKLECELFDDKAPITVANFIGLARGLRPFKAPDGKWTKKPAYDGTTFHRVIKGFMIQGGDPSGTGAGEPGYVIPDEIWAGATHDKRGQLCMANRGPNTNGQQFFITDAAAPHLDHGYTIFGQCGPDSVMDKLAGVPVQGDHSVTPTKIKKITIKRKAK
jgi:peptidyl-prolyl cis-trans isomerase A (cyclophilin A)